MLFNAEKCKYIHSTLIVDITLNNKQYHCFMVNERTETTPEERELRVIFTETLDVTKQCVRPANNYCKRNARHDKYSL